MRGPTDVSLSNNSINENVDHGGNITSRVSQSGEVVGTLSANDPEGDSIVEYTLTDENGNPIDHPQFEISGNQIVVKSGADIDFEAGSDIEVFVTATDSSGASSTSPFTIELNDFEASFTGSDERDVIIGSSEEDTISAGDDGCARRERHH